MYSITPAHKARPLLEQQKEKAKFSCPLPPAERGRDLQKPHNALFLRRAAPGRRSVPVRGLCCRPRALSLCRRSQECASQSFPAGPCARLGNRHPTRSRWSRSSARPISLVSSPGRLVRCSQCQGYRTQSNKL